MDLVEILQKVPVGTMFWSPIFTDMRFEGLLQEEVEDDKSDYFTDKNYPIFMRGLNGAIETFTHEGKYVDLEDGECMIFPSKENHDWEVYAKSLEQDIQF